MKFEEVLPDLLSGAKVRCTKWPNGMNLTYVINAVTNNKDLLITTKEAKRFIFISEIFDFIKCCDWEVIQDEYIIMGRTIENIINDMSGTEPIKRAAWYNNPTKLLIPIQSWEDMEEYIDTFDKDEVQSINIYCYDNNIYVGCKLTDEDLNATDWCMCEME